MKKIIFVFLLSILGFSKSAISQQINLGPCIGGGTACVQVTGVLSTTQGGTGSATAFGYEPSFQHSLNLTVSAGKANCGNGVITSYAGGTLTMSANTTNYVYLDTTNSCNPSVKTTSFISSDIPIASIVTNGSTILSVNDVRTAFQVPNAGGGATLPTSALVFGLTSNTSRAATTSDLATLLSTASNCNSSNTTYNPFTNTCITNAGGGATLPTSSLVFGLTSTTSRAATTSDLATLLATSTNCNNSNATYNPFTNTCITNTGSAPAPPSFAVQLANSGATSFAADPNILIDTVAHTLTSPNITASTGTLSSVTGTVNSTDVNCFLISNYGTTNVCNRESYAFSTNISRYAHPLNLTTWGPAGGSQLEAKYSHSFGLWNIFDDAGGGQDQEIESYKDGVGDHDIFNISVLDRGGAAYANDQGHQLFAGVIGDAFGEPNMTVATGGFGSTSPMFTGTPSNNAGTGCGVIANGICHPAANTWVYDATQGAVASGFLTGPSQNFVGPAGGCANFGWLRQFPVSNTLPVTSAFGCGIDVYIFPNTTPNAPVSTTFTLNGGSGTFAPGDMICAGGDAGGFENAIISAVSGASPTQTITVPLFQHNNNIAIAKGSCQILVFNGPLNAPSVGGYHTSYIAFPSVNSSALVYSVEQFDNAGATILPLLNSYETTNGTGDPNSGYSTYLAARVTQNVDVKVDGYYIYAYDHSNFTPNQLNWNPGDIIVNPHFDSQSVWVEQLLEPCLVENEACNGHVLTQQGIGATGSLANGFVYENTNPASIYKFGGGNLNPPETAFQVGANSTAFVTNYVSGAYTPIRYMGSKNITPGQTTLDVVDNPWGTISQDDTNFNIVNSGLTVQGGIVSSGDSFGGGNMLLSFGYSLFAGAGFSGQSNGQTYLGLYNNQANSDKSLAVYSGPRNITAGFGTVTTLQPLRSSEFIADSGSNNIVMNLSSEDTLNTAILLGNSTSKQWANLVIGSDGGTYGVGSYDFFDVTDNVLPFAITPTGIAALSAVITGNVNASTGTFSSSLTVAGNNVCQSTGTNCPFASNTITPLYTTTGTLMANSHTVSGVATLPGSASGNIVVITLSGPAVYSSTSTYACVLSLNDVSATNLTSTVSFSAIAGNQFSITGQNLFTSSVTFLCTGY